MKFKLNETSHCSVVPATFQAVNSHMPPGGFHLAEGSLGQRWPGDCLGGEMMEGLGAKGNQECQLSVGVSPGTWAPLLRLGPWSQGGLSRRCLPPETSGGPQVPAPSTHLSAPLLLPIRLWMSTPCLLSLFLKKVYPESPHLAFVH